MARPQADLEGFAEAQRALRERFAREVVFLLPAVKTYSDTDPESGEPYDPWETPSGTVAASQVTLMVNVVARPIGNRADVTDDVEASPIGKMSRGHTALIVDVDDAASIEDATHFILDEERYEITDRGLDALGSAPRYLIWGSRG